ncbi:TPA: LeoA/HP0731 family dynamin-like GTPase [Yersinia enterocolitica]|uniref:LeoA/HP0731 family dynamin-like GTPase n=1 Tax=Yersinia enterocolitica TaxID=630 RepID=UPI0005E7F04E|nr:LeoA/HP0731 family dynamin-like GTPase [Yersinia enterocolitica]EKN3400905.1 50S ribosome-binding GTPase [Yersinia enterocolitica]EKN3995816.1 50S ribosome-binding GTPase [Yersinia enterocolitica]EKN5085476.1 labile enterotoxin output A [Yersinia enterocolitica]EKN6133144.1 labile enterotoxin output A [Yersinia enterocolitica]ELX2226709.1 50S ribosome-binding GTPase [Yersinia enterocolitica]
MTNTVVEFKHQQEKTRQALKKLADFIDKGRNFGLNPDAALMEKLTVALKTSEEKILKVALIGGFSEGKTSIASAWLERLDKSMNISQQESSNEVQVYRLDNDIELIDTPGLFGFKEQLNSVGEIEKYKETTKKYVSEAHLVLYVMNSVNPVKESHIEDLTWLFRDLNLLPRTVFVLSRFDEIADIEDDWDYRENLKIKKENVVSRLKKLINLTEKEAEYIKIVGVSANPFGEGTSYWLEHLEEFKKISRISTLQNATHQTITQNGGATPIVLETQKSIIQDVLGKQMPKVRQQQEQLDHQLSQLSDAVQHLNNELAPMEAKIANVRVELLGFVSDYFTSLIRQVKGTDLTTFNDFYESEIGAEGIVLNTEIEKEFSRQCQAVSSSLHRISLDFDNEITRFETSVGADLAMKGISTLKNVKLNNTHILAARDGIVSAGKMVGMDLAKYLKFKPWGAINFAAKANAILAVAGLVMEAWDSYKKAKAEEDFRALVSEIVLNLENQRKGLIELLKQEDFINQLFPTYNKLQENLNLVLKANAETASRKQSFDEWQHEGAIIEGEYRIIKENNF